MTRSRTITSAPHAKARTTGRKGFRRRRRGGARSRALTLLAVALHEAARALERELDERQHSACSLYTLSLATYQQGDHPRAVPPGPNGPALAPLPLRPPATGSDAPTPREIDVLRLLAMGHSNREIAGDLVVSVRTVEHHITSLYAKIGARGRADAATYAVRHGLLPAAAG